MSTRPIPRFARRNQPKVNLEPIRLGANARHDLGLVELVVAVGSEGTGTGIDAATARQLAAQLIRAADELDPQGSN